MSAFIASPETYQTVYNGLRHVLTSSEYESTSARTCARTLVDASQPTGRDEIQDRTKDTTRRLYALNVRAVNQRYVGDSTSEEMPKEIERIVFKSHVPTLEQIIKSLECIHYQMSEGDVPEEWEYKSIGKLPALLAIARVHKSQMYAMSKWD